jgi:DNA replication protein DnaC
MGGGVLFDPILLSQARTRLTARHSARSALASRRREEIYGALPEVAAIDAQMRAGLARAVRKAFLGGPQGASALEDCRERNLILRGRRAELLAENGYPPGALDDQPECPACDDTGFADDQICACLTRVYGGLQRRALSQRLDLDRQSFASFDLSLFSDEEDSDERESPRVRMKLLRDYCQKYVHRFGPEAADLLLRGGPGTGKTFLLSCIAGELAAGPHWVAYETAADAVGYMEAEKFLRDPASAERADRLLSCELLLLDDLGAEFATPFSLAALFQLLSHRMAENRRTIAATALSEAELRRRYPPQLSSRLEAFELLPLFGGDLRRR